MTNDMTMCEVLGDPLIRQLRRADGVSLIAFATLLETAANNRNAAAPLSRPALFEANRLPADGVCPSSH
ncbi:MAG: hypothetical protein ACOH2J_03290 [Allorhizobium sp.]